MFRLGAEDLLAGSDFVCCNGGAREGVIGLEDDREGAAEVSSKDSPSPLAEPNEDEEALLKTGLRSVFVDMLAWLRLIMTDCYTAKLCTS